MLLRDDRFAFERRDTLVLPRQRVSVDFIFPTASPRAHLRSGGMQSSSQRRLRPAGRATADTRSRLLKNGAAAHAFTREDRAKGGRNRAKKIRRRKELREQFEAADFEDLAVAELDLFGRA